MLDDVKTSALANIRGMLRAGKAKRIAGLVKKPDVAPVDAAPVEAAEKKPASLEVHVIKAAAPEVEGSPAEEADESPAEAAAEGDGAEKAHPLHALVMKQMNQILKPKKG